MWLLVGDAVKPLLWNGMNVNTWPLSLLAYATSQLVAHPAHCLPSTLSGHTQLKGGAVLQSSPLQGLRPQLQVGLSLASWLSLRFWGERGVACRFPFPLPYLLTHEACVP